MDERNNDPDDDRLNSFDASEQLAQQVPGGDPFAEFAVPPTGSVPSVPPWATGFEAGPRAARLEAEHRLCWVQSLTAADALLAAAEPRLRGLRGKLGDPAARLRAPLAGVLMAAEKLYGNSRPCTARALLLGFWGDISGDEAINADGNVTPGTFAYQLLENLLTAKDDGVPEPHDAVELWMADDLSAEISDALLTVLGPDQSAFNGGNNHEHSSLNFVVPVVAPTGRSLDDIRAGLDRTPGLAGIKNVFEQFAAVQTVNVLRRRHGLAVDHGTRHMIFTGNPGTGKTTVARIVAEVLDATGSLPGAHLVEADRSMLVGEWLGSSAMKTRKVAEAAFGGVLFVDEAYSLAGQGG
ncbi:MAG: hypothetical protein RLZ55_1606, partial [Actinomycetota bacterium]